MLCEYVFSTIPKGHTRKIAYVKLVGLGLSSKICKTKPSRQAHKSLFLLILKHAKCVWVCEMFFKCQLMYVYWQNHIQDQHRPRKNNKWECVLTQPNWKLSMTHKTVWEVFIQLEKIVMNIWVGTNSHLKMLHQ